MVLAAKPALFQVAPRFLALRGQLLLEEVAGRRQQRVEARALVLATSASRGLALGIGTPASCGQPLDGLGKGQPFGLDQEREDVAVLARGEAVIEALLVVDREGGRPLLLEGRQPLELAPRPLQRHLARHHLADGQPGADLVEQGRRKAHGLRIARVCAPLL